jgi:hypothetical protein
MEDYFDNYYDNYDDDYQCRTIISYNLLGEYLNHQPASRIEEELERIGLNSLLDDIMVECNEERPPIDELMDIIDDTFTKFLRGYNLINKPFAKDTFSALFERSVLVKIGGYDEDNIVDLSIYSDDADEPNESTKINIVNVLRGLQGKEDLTYTNLIIVIIDLYMVGKPICKEIIKI